MKFQYHQNFLLESGDTLPTFHLEYNLYGDIHQKPILWIIHALTGDTQVENWWKGIFLESQILDYFSVICVNNPASPYGSICPLDLNPITQQVYYQDFPLITTRDAAKMFDLLRTELGIPQIYGLIGASLGAQIALEWNILQPHLFQIHLNIAGNAKHSAWGIAFNESQRMAIFADPTYFDNHPDGGKNGLKAARAFAMLSYRSYQLYQKKQTDVHLDKIQNFKSADYQQYQGQKLMERFNAYSYVSLTKMMDSHNIFRNRSGNPLSKIQTKCTFLGIDSDILFPVNEQKFLHSLCKNSELKILSSDYGHDAFLIEKDFIINLLNQTFIQKKLTTV